MYSVSLFPHGNIICEISNLRNNLMNQIFELNSNKKFNIKKITPLFSTFSILEFNSEVKKNTENDLSKISKLFCESKIKPEIQKIQFDGKYFFVNLYHPILSESKKTNLKFIPYSNAFNLLKIEIENLENINLEKIINFEKINLRVFQVAKILQESILEKNNSLEIQTENKKWVKIN
jgi:actin-related protein